MNKIYFTITTIIIITLLFIYIKNKKQTKVKETLKLIFQEGDMPSLSPHSNISHIRCLCLNKLLFESLTRIDGSQKASLAGANSVKISKDKIFYTFILRDCKFSNKEQITAFDYVNAWSSAISPNSLCLHPDLFYVIKNAKAIRQGIKNISEFGAKALDEKTIQIELEYPTSTFLELIANPIYSPIKEVNSNLAAFNGPFIIDVWNKNKNIVLKKNAQYWDQKNIKLDKVEISFVKDMASTLSLFEKQKVDWVGSPINTLSFDDVNSLEKAHILQKRITTLIFWLQINTNFSVFKSKNIRKALSYAIDLKEINNYILSNSSPTSFLPSSITSFEQNFEYNIEKAKKYLIKGLEELNISQDNFPEIKMIFFRDARMEALAQYLEQTWKKILNIKVKLIKKDWNSFRSSIEKNEYEIGGCYETMFFPDPIDLLERIQNKKGWENMQYQKTLISMKNTSNELQKKIDLATFF